MSNHNIEHCNDPTGTFKVMIDRLAPAGSLFVATPAALSTNFPSRSGVLNFFDDPTHKYPVDLLSLFESESHRCDCEFFSSSYKPLFWRAVGLANEPISRLQGRTKLGTWDFYGFEQIIWIRKKGNSEN